MATYAWYNPIVATENDLATYLWTVRAEPVPLQPRLTHTSPDMSPRPQPLYQTFLLEITTHHANGNISLVKSVPCGLPGFEICIVEVGGAPAFMALEPRVKE